MIRVLDGIVEHLPPVDVGDIVVHRKFRAPFEKRAEAAAERAAFRARRIGNDEPSGSQRERDGDERIPRQPRVEPESAVLGADRPLGHGE